MSISGRIRRRIGAIGGAVVAAAMIAGPAGAFSLSFGQGSLSSEPTPTGASGEVDFAFSEFSSGVALLSLEITNTTGDEIFGLGATSSKMTGFGFNLLGG